ncbi:competence protein ComK [Heyndrickxia acidiproducens]|uniref:competence protein ComK n=1 Tax=Heyndrickxia acidiproducens TaxID=1121084 RepID=UPI0003643732|nr:competence protein ComK [Heyndrickxia acidiproducens]
MTREFDTDYEISPYTMAIVPYHNGSESGSKVFEINCELLLKENPLEIVKYSCAYFGSSYEGRRKGTENLIEVRLKPPLLIDPHTNIIILPTASPNHPKCIWLVPQHIKSHRQYEGRTTEIILSNQKKLIIPISHGSFLNQLHKAATLQMVYERNRRRAEEKYLMRQKMLKQYHAYEDHEPYQF